MITSFGIILFMLAIPAVLIKSPEAKALVRYVHFFNAGFDQEPRRLLQER